MIKFEPLVNKTLNNFFSLLSLVKPIIHLTGVIMKFKLFLFIFTFSITFLFLWFCKAPEEKLLTDEQIEQKINELLEKLTFDEKITMLSGDSTGFNAPGIKRLGIPSINMTDGPVGVRTGKATAFPVAVNMAASWDTSLIRRYGETLGIETKAKGKTCILGPCVGIHRFPLGGRNFESFGEDPFLSSRLTVSYVKGVQSENVIATVKHYACNDQEWERNNYDVITDERSLREIHLPAFEYAVKEGEALAVMSAYNLVNGEHCSENQHLLNEILKKDWGFKGIVMSDWTSVYSADKAANNGLDLEMPNGVWFGDSLKAAVKDRRVSMKVIDDKIRRLLRVRFKAGYFNNPMPAENQALVENNVHSGLALEMAQKGIVLLKNNNILPLDSDTIKTIALIGPNLLTARTGGGGSSLVNPWKTVSPYEGLQNILNKNAKIITAEGTRIDPVKLVPVPEEYLRTPDGKNSGLKGEYFTNQNFEEKPAITRIDKKINFEFENGGPDSKIGSDNFSIRWTGKFIPEVTANHTFICSSDDGSWLWINGELIIDNGGQHAEIQKSATIPMTAGKEYDIKIEYYEGGGGAVMRFGWVNPNPSDEEKMPTIEEAVAAAKNADVAIVCVGNTQWNEGEGVDVKNFEMDYNQEKLVQEISKVNPNTIVVVYGGVPVLMKNWIGRTKGVLAAFYPGQEGGTALAQILFGEVNPSAKLPFSYIQEKLESPAFNGYMNPDLKVKLDEGIFTGYRYYEKNNIEPLFPFGFGLSYTTFEYSNLKIKKNSRLNYSVSFDIKNTGKIKGAETAQLYIGQKNCKFARPVKELKGFAKTELVPGEKKTVTITLNERSFQYFNPETKEWTADKDEFEIIVGSSSKDIKLKGIINL